MTRRTKPRDLTLAHPLFSGLGESAVARILSHAREVHLRRGDVVYQSGKQATEVSVLLRGALQIEYPSANEKRGPVSTLLVAPAIFGECQLMFEQPWSGTGVALCDVVLMSFTRSSWLSLVATETTLAARLYGELAGRFLLAIESWRHQPSLDPEGLVARYCCGVSLAFERAGDPEPLELTLTQGEIARATSLTRETVNRVLRDWSARGDIASGKGRLTLRRRARLLRPVKDTIEHFIKSFWAPAT